MNKILDIDNLILSFYGPNGRIPGVAGASLEVFTGETVALVGESGCGKTALCRSILRLHSEHAKIEDGSIILDGKNISLMTEREMEKVRGQVVSMVLQEPMSSLNPTLSIGRQIMEPILFHEKIQRSDAKNRAIELLDFVGIDNPEKRYYQFPHHFSGGMRQRVAIAIALACNPKLLIADEPTTSLDIETQNKIMALLKKIVKDRGKALLLVTHD
ncbi:MAG: ABC transporter ATP-binding protein, partial [Eubacteriales bacterium]|nr:ABC transporter ATP-binding protein [Eubacteriales bacterium]